MVVGKWFTLAVVLSLSLHLVSCGGQGLDAEVVEVAPPGCPTVDETLSSTMDAARAGKLASLVPYFEALEGRDGLDGALRVVLGLLRALGRDVINVHVVSELRATAEALQPTLLRLLSPYADAAANRDRDAMLPFDAMAEMLSACPAGTFSEPLAVLLTDRELVDSLIALLDDPGAARLIAGATGPIGSPSGRDGFIALLDAVGVALQSDDFDFDALANLLGSLMPIDEPPLDRVLAAARPLLTGDNLALFRLATSCMASVSREVGTCGAQNGMQLVAAALYELVAQELPDLAALLDTFRPVLTGSADPDVLALASLLTDAFSTDAELRNALVGLLAFSLEIERVPLLFDAGRSLLEAGSLAEGVDLLQILSEEDCTGVGERALGDLSRTAGAP